MTWFKVDDGFAFHPKALQAGNAALGLWVRAGAWCGANLTDGALPKYMIGTLGAQARDARRLVDVGLWVETDDGYQFHEWAGMQPTKADVLAEREKNRKRQKEWKDRKNNTVSDIVSDHVTNDAPSRPVPTRPLNTEAKASVPRKRGRRIPEDFAVTPEMVQWAAENTPAVDGRLATQKFINYWTAKTGKDATKLDWVATWRNWMLSDQEKAAPRDGGLTTSEKRIQTNLLRGQQWQPTVIPDDVFSRKALEA